MTTSRFNQRRRKRAREDRDAAKRRMRRKEGNWKFGPYRIRPNQQIDREDQSKDRR